MSKSKALPKELFEKAEKVLEESKKLSTKERKALKKSSFCGPGRSFPVNDCAHYTAALRLLNRSKYSDSTKANIRACINRKGKAMGCSGSKKEKSFIKDYGMSVDDLINSEIFATTRVMVEESIKNPGMDLDFSGIEFCDCKDN